MQLVAARVAVREMEFKKKKKTDRRLVTKKMKEKRLKLRENQYIFISEQARNKRGTQASKRGTSEQAKGELFDVACCSRLLRGELVMRLE